MWKRILLIMGLAALMVSQVNAQSVSLGPQAGYYKAKDTDGNFMGGVAWRFKLSQMLGLEASINYRQEKYADDALTVRSWPVMVTGLIYPLPIVYGAIGAAGTTPPSIMTKTSSRFLRTRPSRNLVGILAAAWNCLSVQISN